MPKGLRTASILVLALALGVVALMGSEPLKIGEPVPAFELKDVSGNVVKLADFKGKFVVLEWTNPNCPFVVRHYEQAGMGALQKECVEKGAVWLTINSTSTSHKDFEKPERLSEIYAKWKAHASALLMDSDGTVGKKYDAKTTPHMYLIGKDGKLLYQGAIDDDPRGSKEARVQYVRESLAEAMKGGKVAQNVTTPYGCSVKY
ncbi:MAG: redoxin domain-containing protein [Ignavibacteria bacterium]|nr:redoxin domain-containing protein [Ignavibacteria bacterium]